MTIKVNPPPLQVPSEFTADKEKVAFFGGLLNTIYQIWTTVYTLRFQAKVKTVDATPTGLIRTTVQNGRTVMIEARVVARRTGGTAGTDGDSAFYVLTGAYKNINGVLTGIGTPNLVQGENQAGWNIAFTTSGLDAVVIVTGAANNEVTWEGTISTYEVGA